MTHDELTQAFRDATATPPTGARERVWRRLAAPRPVPARASWLTPALLLCASIAVGVVVTRGLLPERDGAGRWGDEHSAVQWTQARATQQGRTLMLEHGAVAVSSWGAPFEVRAQGHVVRVERGVAVVHVAGESVTADAVEGALWFDGVERQAAARAPVPALAQTIGDLESAGSRARRLVARAEQAVEERRFADAAAAFAEVASSGSLDAEVANFKKGELELRQLESPERALATFTAGEDRFPSGALTQERQLSALESCVKLSRWPEVERRTTAFLQRHAQSERADEVRGLHAQALAAQGDLPGACAELASLPLDRATSLRARCP